MNCTDAIAVMLECELAELSPGGAGPLPRHLAGCRHCRARAEAIVAGTEALRRDVAALRERGGGRVAPDHRRRAVVAGALSIAAGVLLIVGLRERSLPSGVAPASSGARAASAPPRRSERGTIIIDQSHGRPVTIVHRQDTIDVVFHPVTND